MGGPNVTLAPGKHTSFNINTSIATINDFWVQTSLGKYDLGRVGVDTSYITQNPPLFYITQTITPGATGGAYLRKPALTPFSLRLLSLLLCCVIVALCRFVVLQPLVGNLLVTSFPFQVLPAECM